MIKTFQARILIKALGKEEVASIYEQYIEARVKSRGNQPPSKNHLHLAALGKKLGASAAARKAGTTTGSVDYAMTRVARYEYLTK